MWALARVFVYWRLARADHRFGLLLWVVAIVVIAIAALATQVTGPTGLDALRRRLPGGARGEPGCWPWPCDAIEPERSWWAASCQDQPTRR